MKNTKKIGLLVLALAINTVSHAQLGGMLKKAAKNVATDQATKAVTGSTSSSSSSSSNSGSGSTASSVALDWKQHPQTAAITMESLLKFVDVTTEGNVSVNLVRGTFVPSKTASGADVNFYNSGILKSKIYCNDQLIKECTYDDSKYSMEGKKVTWITNSGSSVQAEKEGKYRVDFYAGGVMFYTFPFEVMKKVDTDPYAANNTLWYSTGPWEKYAWVTPESSGNFIFGFHMRHLEFKPDPNDARKQSKSVSWNPELMQNGKVISEKNPKKESVDKGEWKDCTTSMKLIGGKDWLKIADLKDGSYTMKVTVEGEAAPRMYDFKMSGGRIVYSDRQDRTKNTDPKTLIEGWNDFFWLERK